jgi:Fic family protein
VETPTRIEPARLDHVPEAIADLIADLSAATASLGGSLAPQTALSLAGMVRIMNTYYSNLIEGNVTRPRDIEEALGSGAVAARGGAQSALIEQALHGAPATKKGVNDLLVEAVAHVRVQAQIDAMAAQSQLPEPCSEEFIKWLHREFYRGATATMLEVSGRARAFQMVPGVWRNTPEQDVAVGRHFPPSSEHVGHFMSYFSSRYLTFTMGKAARILAIPAAHHRFNYIHPFPDGNGRVSRLMSHAMGHMAGIGAHGLWSVSRGLARGLNSRHDYKTGMELADSPRQGDLDGRGNLSQTALTEFTKWFLQICIDQVQFMNGLFGINTLADRLKQCVAETGFKKEGGRLLEEALIRGQFDRGDAARLTGLPERSARRVLAEMSQVGLLGSDTPKGPVQLRFPLKYQDVLFPRLFVEA